MRRFAVPAALALVLLSGALRPRSAEMGPTASRADVPPAGAIHEIDLAPEPAVEETAPSFPVAIEEGPYEVMKEVPPPAWFTLLLESQNPDGSWGDLPLSCQGHLLGPVGLTGLALGAFFAAGYSHISRDEYEGRVVGKTIKTGLYFLRDRIGADGRFDGAVDAADQALGAFALSEAYGLTGSRWLKEPAERTVDGLLSLQHRDGSWGSGAQTDWAAQTVESAKLSGIDVDLPTFERLRSYYELREARGLDVGAAYFRIKMLKERPPSVDETTAWIAAQPAQSDPDRFREVFLRASVLRGVDGTDTERWRTWNRAQLDAYRSFRSDSGAWSGGSPGHTVLRNALGALAESVHYRY